MVEGWHPVCRSWTANDVCCLLLPLALALLIVGRKQQGQTWLLNTCAAVPPNCHNCS